MEGINLKELEMMKFEDNVANNMNKLREEFDKLGDNQIGINVDLRKKKYFKLKKRQQTLNEMKDLPETVDNVQTAVRYQGTRDKIGEVKIIQNEHNRNLKDENYLLGNYPIAENKAESCQRKSKPNIRSRRVRRELVNIFHNPKKANVNRSWYLDPRNPWNKNLRYYKHIKLFDAFYLDFYTREGSDRLPSNETFVKIRPPPSFYATKNPWSARFDSQPVSYYVKEMEKMGKDLTQTEEWIYGRPSKALRREARYKNYTAILNQEELQWKRQLSQIKYKLRKKNITQAEHDKIAEDIEKDKKVKYKLYKTHSTKHIVNQAMDALTIAAEFVKSAIIRDKRDVGDMYEESEEDVQGGFVNILDSKKKARKVSIKSKRVKRDIFEAEKKLQAKLDYVRGIQRRKLSPSLINGKRVVRKKRSDLGSWQHGSYQPPSNSERKPVIRPHLKPLDYEPIARHNALYYDASEEYSHVSRTTTRRTASTSLKPKKTATLPSEEIKRRTELLKNFAEDMENGYRFANNHEKEFLALRTKLNITRKKREGSISVDKAKNKVNNVLMETISKIIRMEISQNSHKIPENSQIFFLSNGKSNLDTKDTVVRSKLRKKRGTLDDLLKGPPPDKFEQKKTKLEVDKEEAGKKKGVVKEMNIAGTENINKKMFQMHKGNIHHVDVDKKVNDDFDDSRRDPDHPDNNRVNIYDWKEQYDRKYGDAYMDEMDESLGIRARMHQDYLKMKKEQKIGLIDRGLLNRMELERAHNERAEFLKRQTIPTTTEQMLRTCDPKDLSSFQSEPDKKGRKRSPAKDRIKERVEELKDLRKGVL